MSIPQVRIEVTGGIAELTEKPQGVRVIIVDYDADSRDPVVAQEYDAEWIINHEECGCLRPNHRGEIDFVPASWETA